MSIDVLQEKIRKLKNPTVLDFSILTEHIPPYIRKNGSPEDAYARFCLELMEGLKGIVPAVRFSFGHLALMGEKGLSTLSQLLRSATEMGYYTLLDSTAILTPWSADRAAEGFFAPDSRFACDGLILSPYIGTDAIKPFLPYCREGKDVFFAVRTPNKSASDLQDLLTGARHVYTAAADLLGRYGETMVGSSGYSNICALVSAGSGASLAELRTKYKRMFLLVDGLDYPAGNAKNCSLAFDRMGHGGAVCAGPSITAAWYGAETDGTDYVEQAVQAAQRVKKNISRYVSII